MQFTDLKAQYQSLKKEIDEEIFEVLNSAQFIMGPQVARCERALESFTGAKNSLTCSSGTDAIVMALMALEIGYGDEVIVPNFSFFASAESVSLVGAKPVFVDIEDETYNIDIAQIEKHITKKTKAIVFVSLYGQTPDVDSLLELGKKYNIHIIEDAAQSFGATYKNKKSCNLTPISCTSFFPAKPLGCYGDGGAVFLNDDKYLQALKEIRIHGQSGRYIHNRVGINGRMDSIQCGIITAKLKKFEWEVQQRIDLGTFYSKAFCDLSKIKPPKVASNRTHVYGQYTLYVENREKFIKTLEEKGIPTSVHYPSPLHQQKPYFKDNEHLQYPVSERCSKHVVSLPMHAYLKKEDKEKIVDAVLSAHKLL